MTAAIAQIRTVKTSNGGWNATTRREDSNMSPSTRLKNVKTKNHPTSLAESIQEAVAANSYVSVFVEQMKKFKNLSNERRIELNFPGEALGDEKAEEAFASLAKIYNFKDKSEQLSSKTMNGLGFDEMMEALLLNPIPNMNNEEFIDVFNDIGAVLISLKEATSLLTSLSGIAVIEATRRTAEGKLTVEDLESIDMVGNLRAVKSLVSGLESGELSIKEDALEYGRLVGSNSQGALDVIANALAEFSHENANIQAAAEAVVNASVRDATGNPEATVFVERQNDSQTAMGQAMKAAVMTSSGELPAEALAVIKNAQTQGKDPVATPAKRGRS